MELLVHTTSDLTSCDSSLSHCHSMFSNILKPPNHALSSLCSTNNHFFIDVRVSFSERLQFSFSPC